jgi:hypothetical protein
MTMIISKSIHIKLRNICKTNCDNEVQGYIENDNIYIINNKPIDKCEIKNNISDDEKFIGKSIIFHTHPSYCYLLYNVFIGVPSLTDLMNMPLKYILNKNKYFLVVSIEGTYLCAVNTNHYLIKNKSINKINDIISSVYEGIRNKLLSANSNNRPKIIKLFIDSINKTNIIKITMYGEPCDISL